MKNKIELFIEQENLVLEVEISKDGATAMLYKKDDLYIKAFLEKTVNEAINSAVIAYKERKRYGVSRQ